nr:hypothetical protein [Mucilaginibacter sp. X5P1]
MAIDNVNYRLNFDRKSANNGFINNSTVCSCYKPIQSGYRKNI